MADLSPVDCLSLPMTGQGGETAGRALRRGYLLRFSGMLALSGLFVFLLAQRVAEIDFDATWAAAARVAPAAWLAAIALTFAAFWSVGRYDAVLHCHLETGVDARRARAAGISAIAVSQTLGFGVITRAVLRWRMLPDHSFSRAAQITAAVAASFLAGWAVVTSVTVIVLGTAGYAGFGWAGVTLAAIAAALCIAAPPAPFRWPSLFTILTLIGLCAVDTLAAAGALYVLLPPEIALPAARLLPAFLIAYGAGMISGAPGGIGAFELTLLALLPDVPEGPLIAAIVGWRLIYFVLPALVGAGMAMAGPRRRQARAILRDPAKFAAFGQTLPQEVAQTNGVSPELGLLSQGEHRLLRLDRQSWLSAARGHVLVGLFDPILTQQCAAQRRAALEMMDQAAKVSGRWPALYKVSAPMAATARAAGWRCVRAAREAVLDLSTYDLNSPARAGLRRKLRRAQASGISVTHLPTHALPFAQLDALATLWAQGHGGERGFTTGRYSRDYLAT